MSAETLEQPPAATFVGIQRGIPGRIADLPLFNLNVEIPGHCAGSTVSEKTLVAAGIPVPAYPKGGQS